jgi:hypothetical protein
MNILVVTCDNIPKFAVLYHPACGGAVRDSIARIEKKLKEDKPLYDAGTLRAALDDQGHITLDMPEPFYHMKK